MAAVTTTAPAAEDNTAVQTELELTGVAGWVQRERATIARWREQGQAFLDYTAAYDEATVITQDSLISEKELIIAALEDPKITGRSFYTARDALVDIRNLRDRNRNLTAHPQALEQGLHLSHWSSPRTKIRWDLAEHTGGNAETMAGLLDTVAKKLALAIKEDQTA